jgi:ribonuclease J
VHAAEAEDLLDECGQAVVQELKTALVEDPTHDIETLGRVVRRAAGRFVNERTRRRPMIVPVVMEA